MKAAERAEKAAAAVAAALAKAEAKAATAAAAAAAAAGAEAGAEARAEAGEKPPGGKGVTACAGGKGVGGRQIGSDVKAPVEKTPVTPVSPAKHRGKVPNRVNVQDDLPRDQGFVRPTVLILVPMRNVAGRVVRRLLQLCPAVGMYKL